MSLRDVQAVIESAKARGREPLEDFLRDRMPGADDERIQEAADVAVETIEAVPVFLARASQEAESRDMADTVEPLLRRVETYFVRPVDLIPEMTQGLAGLLDDTYLVLRLLQGLDQGPEPFLDWELDEPVRLLRSLVGREIARELDAIAFEAMQGAMVTLSKIWDGMATEA